jgi:hypothetical protein
MLNNFGKIAVGELVVYLPILCISIFMALRHGFNPKEGWIFLFLFCSGMSWHSRILPCFVEHGKQCESWELVYQSIPSPSQTPRLDSSRLS